MYSYRLPKGEQFVLTGVSDSSALFYHSIRPILQLVNNGGVSIENLRMSVGDSRECADNIFSIVSWPISIICKTRGLGALRAPTSSWRPFGPEFHNVNFFTQTKI